MKKEHDLLKKLNLDNEQRRILLEWILKNQQVKKSVKDIAVIGLSGRYPKSENLNAFWENLVKGVDCISEVPKDRWNWEQFNVLGISKWGGFIEDVDKFDSVFFSISPKEAEGMDPQERLFLETAWVTLEDGGYTKKALSEIDHNVGVFVGVMNCNYEFLAGEALAKGVLNQAHSAYWSIANRVSYFFNFQGPSLAVDTACSSSLTAIHLACESLRREECKVAIAGGVNLILHPKHYIGLTITNLLSKTGRCRSFGKGADGFVDGEGVGAVLLKPLEKAILEKDYIYAVIKGSFINSGGKTSGYSVPNPNAQSNLILTTMKKADINPRTISYIEAQGVGTSLGDPLEIAGLAKAFRRYTTDKQYCSIGSVKSNIGHLESASGIAGLTKVILQMKHGKLVPSLNSKDLNPKIKFTNTPFFVQQELMDWERPVIKMNGKETTYPRRAGLSSFGAGGANAHIIIEEYAYSESLFPPKTNKSHIIVLSAVNKDRLKAYAQSLLVFLNNIDFNSSSYSNRPELSGIAYTLQIRRNAMAERLAVVATSVDELIYKLSCYLENKKVDDLYLGNASKSGKRSDSPGSREGTQEIIDQWINERNISKIAESWVEGIDVDWRLLHHNQKQRPVSLPTYPFVRERYWISKSKDNLEILSKWHAPVEKKSIIDTKDITGEIKKVISKVIKVDNGFINKYYEDIESTPFSNFGFDSILMLEIIQHMNNLYQIEITLSDFENIRTVKELEKTIIMYLEDNTNRHELSTSSEENKDGQTFKPINRYDGSNKFSRTLINNEIHIRRYNKLLNQNGNFSLFNMRSQNDFEFEVFTIGNGEPVVLLPPIDCIASAWVNQILELSNKFTIVIINYPGYGMSKFNSGLSQFDIIADSILKILNSFEIQKNFHLVGWSMGGLIAQLITEKNPLRVRSLTLVNTTSKLKEDSSINNLITLSKLMKDDLIHNVPKIQNMTGENLRHMIKGTYNSEVSLHYLNQVLNFDNTKAVTRINRPTLLISGAEDKLTPPENMHYIHKNIKDSEYHMIQDGGHYIPLQCPDFFNDKLLTFYSKT